MRGKEDLPAEFYVSYSIERAARLSDNSASTVRKLINTGFLSKDRGEIIDLGTASQHNWKVTREGLFRLTGTRLPVIDIHGLAMEIIQSIGGSK